MSAESRQDNLIKQPQKMAEAEVAKYQTFLDDLKIEPFFKSITDDQLKLLQVEQSQMQS